MDDLNELAVFLWRRNIFLSEVEDGYEIYRADAPLTSEDFPFRDPVPEDEYLGFIFEETITKRPELLIRNILIQEAA